MKIIPKYAIIKTNNTSKTTLKTKQAEIIRIKNQILIHKNLHTTIRKVSDFFFLENLEDFNEARLHEATYNHHTHA